MVGPVSLMESLVWLVTLHLFKITTLAHPECSAGYRTCRCNGNIIVQMEGLASTGVM